MGLTELDLSNLPDNGETQDPFKGDRGVILDVARVTRPNWVSQNNSIKIYIYTIEIKLSWVRKEIPYM